MLAIAAPAGVLPSVPTGGRFPDALNGTLISSVLFLAGPLLGGCASGGASGGLSAGGETGAEPGFALQSTAFDDGQAIPTRYTADGEDISPPLTFAGAPEGTVELALTVVDPDAPRGDFVHWVIYKIGADVSGLPEGVPTVETLTEPAGVLQGENGFGAIGYGGPAPPPGDADHRYVFTLYALNAELDVEPGADAEALLEAVSGLIIDRAELTGTFGR